MALIRYSAWDGSQQPFTLEAENVLDELSKYLMEGLDLDESLDWMRYQGFELAGMDFRVMGVEEMLEQLRQQARDLMNRFNMDHTFDEKWSALQDALDKEEATVSEERGVESEAWNDFQNRRDKLPWRLSDALRRFEDYEWADAEAEAAFRELMESLEDASDLERFFARNKNQLKGGKGLDFDEALDLMRQVEQLGQMAKDLLEGNFSALMNPSSRSVR